MIVEQTSLDGVLLIKPDIHTDFRGDYAMTYHKDKYDTFCRQIKNWREDAPIEFVEHDISTSTKGVLRGIHYSPTCWKINQCLHGTIYYVVVNCNEESPEFGKWQSFILSDKNRYQLFKHPRYGSGFYVLSDFAVFHYIQSEYYNPDKPKQETFKWNDGRFNIWWPTDNPILSQRDQEGDYIPRA